MSRQSLILLVLCLSAATWLHAADPMSFQEISFMVRTGETPQNIVNEAARRKLFMALTAGQEAKLQQNGAPPALITALRSPLLLASPAELQSYVARRQAQAQVALAEVKAMAHATPAPLQAIVLPDHFSGSLEAAKTAPARSMSESDAFSLAQLDDARAKARSEQKPVGFIVATKKCFGQAYTTRQTGGYAALLHLYEAFKDPLVLVFVPADTEVAIPGAVARGAKAAHDKGLAPPFMVVTDAGMTEDIGVIPTGDAKADGEKRDEIFKVAAASIQGWLSYHPAAISTGPPPPPPAAR